MPDVADYVATELERRQLVDGARVFEARRVRITRPDEGRTYVEFYASDRPGPRPLVVATIPYAGIDWSGEALDLRWATSQPRMDGTYLDVDGPDFDGSRGIVYEPPVAGASDDQARIHLLNDASVLLVYGRFYAGGDVRDDVMDMAAGMWFAAEQEAVDASRIGVFGGSWGGFEAIYAAAYADARAPARVVAALFPPVDFPSFEAHVSSAPISGGFFDAYRARIHHATGGPSDAPGADYSGLRFSDLCAGLPPATLLLHDEWDALVPIAQSTQLVAECGGELLLWPRQSALDPTLTSHGPIALESPFPSSWLYALAYIHLHLALPDQPAIVLVYSSATLIEHLETIRAEQLAGGDVDFVLPRLRELLDPRLSLLRVEDSAVVSGALAVAESVNAVWGTRFDATSIRAGLEPGLPQ
jgi:hypothetical protein